MHGQCIRHSGENGFSSFAAVASWTLRTAVAAAVYGATMASAEDDSMADELAALIETAGDTVNQFEVRRDRACTRAHTPTRWRPSER